MKTKFRSLLFLAVLVPFLFSCKDDNDGKATISFDAASSTQVTRDGVLTVSGSVKSDEGTTIESIVATCVYEAGSVEIATMGEAGFTMVAGNHYTFSFTQESKGISEHLEDIKGVKIVVKVKNGEEEQATHNITPFYIEGNYYAIDINIVGGEDYPIDFARVSLLDFEQGENFVEDVMDEVPYGNGNFRLRVPLAVENKYLISAKDMFMFGLDDDEYAISDESALVSAEAILRGIETGESEPTLEFSRYIRTSTYTKIIQYFYASKPFTITGSAQLNSYYGPYLYTIDIDMKAGWNRVMSVMSDGKVELYTDIDDSEDWEWDVFAIEENSAQAPQAQRRMPLKR